MRPDGRPAGRRPVAVLATLVATALAATVLAACGIASDDSPRALTVSTTTTQPSATPTSGGTAAVLYYVAGKSLVPLSRSLADRRPGTVLNALLEPPGDAETARGLTTSIPNGTELRGLTTDGDILEVDLSSDFENVAGPGRQQAIGQMVMTATEFPEIRRVRFRVGGKPVQVTSLTRGDTSVVTECDFAELLPTAEQARELDLDPAVNQRLAQRRADVERRCA
ncbi:MAG: GerMN domain-containing protein [Microthrixaceae bacterium]